MVICIESYQRPDLLRTSTPYKDGASGVDRAGYFAYFAANKYSISLNLNKPNGLKIARKLVSSADVVADSHRPGVMERWKLGYDDLVKIKTDIIMIRNSNQGLTGPAACLYRLFSTAFRSYRPDRCVRLPEKNRQGAVDRCLSIRGRPPASSPVPDQLFSEQERREGKGKFKRLRSATWRLSV